MYYKFGVRRNESTYSRTYIIGIVIVFLEFVSNGKHLAIFEVGRAFGQNAFRGAFNVGS